MRDIDGIIDIARYLTQHYPQLRVNALKTRQRVIDAVSGSHNWAMVSERKDGIVVGALVVFVCDHFWAERQNAVITLWYSEVPGDGMKMMREFMRWVNSRRAIKQIELAIDMQYVDHRVGHLLSRCGMIGAEVVYKKFRT